MPNLSAVKLNEADRVSGLAGELTDEDLWKVMDGGVVLCVCIGKDMANFVLKRLINRNQLIVRLKPSLDHTIVIDEHGKAVARCINLVLKKDVTKYLESIATLGCGS